MMDKMMSELARLNVIAHAEKLAARMLNELAQLYAENDDKIREQKARESARVWTEELRSTQQAICQTERHAKIKE